MVTLDENVIEVERRFNGNTKIATNVGVLVVVSRRLVVARGVDWREWVRSDGSLYPSRLGNTQAVEPESPAGRSRAIKPGDVITKINDKAVRTAG
jgi:hypothetical protein